MKVPPPAAKKGATFKKVGNINAGHGHITGIRQGSSYGGDTLDDSGLAEVSIRHGAKPKPPSVKKRDYGMIRPDVKTSSVHIPADEAKGLKIGQRVKVSLSPA